MSGWCFRGRSPGQGIRTCTAYRRRVSAMQCNHAQLVGEECGARAMRRRVERTLGVTAQPCRAAGQRGNLKEVGMSGRCAKILQPPQAYRRRGIDNESEGGRGVLEIIRGCSAGQLQEAVCGIGGSWARGRLRVCRYADACILERGRCGSTLVIKSEICRLDVPKMHTARGVWCVQHATAASTSFRIVRRSL